MDERGVARVRLDRVAAGDGPALIAGNRESRGLHAPYVAPFTDVAGFEAWLASLDTPANVSFVVRDEASAAIAGVINFSQIFMGNFCSAYCGFYALAPMAGRGLMTAGLLLAVEEAFSGLGLHRLEANIQPENHRSIALVARVGFRKEGFSPGYLRIGGAWRDHERWALVARE